MQHFPATTQSFAHYILHSFIIFPLAGELQCCPSKSRHHQQPQNNIFLEPLNRSRNHFYPKIRNARFLFFLYRILHLIIIMFILCLPFYLYIYISMSTWYFHIYTYNYGHAHQAHKNTHNYA